MNSKAFSILLVATLVLGVALGGAFAGGFAMGKSRGPDQSQGSATLRPPSGFQAPGGQREGGGGFAGRGGRPTDGSPAGGFAGGERPNGGDTTASAGDSLGSGTGQGLFGSVVSFQDGLITLDSRQGPVQAAISEDTAIQKTVTGTAEDLVVGAEVRILGRRVEDGPVQARSITLTGEGPDGLSGSFVPPSGGRRGFSGGTSFSGTIEGVESGLLSVATDDGTLPVALGEDTVIQKMEAGSGADLVEGARVSITGTQDEESVLQASLVVLTPEGVDRFSRRGPRDGDRPPQ